MEIWDEIKASFREGSVITRLIYVNLSVFLVFRLLQVVFFLSGSEFTLIRWFELPASIEAFIRQPWSLVTYMFLHFDFLHILFNLLVLYWFGRIFMDYFNPAQLLGLYIAGGLAGGVFYILAYNLFPAFGNAVRFTYLLGASASVIAILIAAAFRDPNRAIHLMLIGKIPLKYLALFMVISYIIGISGSNAGGNLAHLGGVVAGYAFFAMIRNGKDFASPISGFLNNFRPKKPSGKKFRVIHRQPPRDDYEYNRQKASDHKELNRILDKIAEKGYDALTKDEKETLFRHGK
ncbi:MAG TPA: rhomboid family intramembrane serine protease [Prolixibacteraceae bacterium]|nr:rhomboid family intramembrane serine protease [Prolixibacteraceae bacterium]